MAVVLNAIAADPDANAYCTLEEAVAYVDSHIASAKWDAASADERRRAIVTATALLDSTFEWTGEPTTYEQKLMWPRTGCVSRTGNDLPDDTIPGSVKDATAELARQLLVSDRTADNEAEAAGLTSLSAAGISLNFQSGATSKPIPDAVTRMLSHLGTVAGSSFVVPLVRT